MELGRYALGAVANEFNTGRTPGRLDGSLPAGWNGITIRWSARQPWPRSKRHLDLQSSRYTDTYSYSNAERDTNTYTYTYSNSYAYRYADPYSYRNSDGHAHSYPNCNSNHHSKSYTYRHTDPNSDPDSYANPNSHSNADCWTDTKSQCRSFTDSDPCRRRCDLHCFGLIRHFSVDHG